MYNEIFIAGSGGQGIISLGRTLSIAACEEGKYVTFYPSYGAEIRGGTANCVVKISDKFIYSPVLERPTILMVMNFPSYLKFVEKYLPEKLLVINSSLIPEDQVKKSFQEKFLKINQTLNMIVVRATEIADKIGSTLVANMVLLGSMIKVSKIVKIDTIKKIIEKTFKKEIVQLNIKAVESGAENIES